MSGHFLQIRKATILLLSPYYTIQNIMSTLRVYKNTQNTNPPIIANKRLTGLNGHLGILAHTKSLIFPNMSNYSLLCTCLWSFKINLILIMFVKHICPNWLQNPSKNISKTDGCSDTELHLINELLYEWYARWS